MALGGLTSAMTTVSLQITIFDAATATVCLLPALNFIHFILLSVFDYNFVLNIALCSAIMVSNKLILVYSIFSFVCENVHSPD